MLTLQIPESIEQEAHQIARRTQRPVESIIMEWLEFARMEAPVESLSDERVLELCDQMLPVNQQAELSQLIDRNRNGDISPQEIIRLDELMDIYQRGMVRKAEAWKVAVERGLRPPLHQWTGQVK
jgi:hypothetical protein